MIEDRLGRRRIVFRIFTISLIFYFCYIIVKVKHFVYDHSDHLILKHRSGGLVDYTVLSANYSEGNSVPNKLVSGRRSRKLPACLIIGVRKGGTRALLKFLSANARIRMAGKEIHFFDKNDRYRRGFAWYKSRMPLSFANQITVEKTPAYFHEPAVPRRVFFFNPKIKLILVVRDPLTRMISDYTQTLAMHHRKGHTYPKFEELVFQTFNGNYNSSSVNHSNLQNPTGGSLRHSKNTKSSSTLRQVIDLSYKPLQRSLYNLHTRRWLRYFPQAQIHLVDGDRLINQPWEQVALTETFLNIRNPAETGRFYFNRTRGFYCHRYLEKASGHGCLGRSKGRKHPKISLNTRWLLNNFFRPFVEDFYSLVGQRFEWLKEHT